MSVQLNILSLCCINLHYTSAERRLKGRKHFSQSIMVFAALTKLGKTDDQGATINSAYITVIMYSNKDYCQKICHLSNNDFLFRQDGAPFTIHASPGFPLFWLKKSRTFPGLSRTPQTFFQDPITHQRYLNIDKKQKLLTINR